MILPPQRSQLAKWSKTRIEECRASQYERATTARSQNTWLYAGSPDGQKAIVNMLAPHIERLASYLYSPSELRFHIDFTHSYPAVVQAQADVAARVLTREFERRDIDVRWGLGVPIALTYGACIPKALDTSTGATCKLVMPWQFGVYKNDEDDIKEQEAVCETTRITMFALWRRISHLPNAIELFRRARQYAGRNTGGLDTSSHPVLIAGTAPVVQTESPFNTQGAGLVQTGGIAGTPSSHPDVEGDLITFHELWVWDDEQEDYTTIQLVEPDILIAPQYRRKNLFTPGQLPYGMIQPNHKPNDFWGLSELDGLQKLQHLMKDRMDDIKKVMSLQYDRLFAFIGGDGMQDETYDQMRQAGFFNLPAGADVKDITPQLPKEAFADIDWILKAFNEISGFNNILSGQGEPGVRAGNHAETLLKTASPRLRDRALLVERQCADFAHKVFELMCAKEAKAYWTDGKDEQEFMLSQLPDDYRIMVDSHSSSPIYEENHMQIAFALAKLQAIGAEDLIELLPLPRKDVLKQHARDSQEAKAAFIQQHPELLMQHGKKK